MKDAPHPPIAEEIGRYYREIAEERRLTFGPPQLEFARTQEMLLRHLPGAPACVLDVGGAAGAYALWLAANGYRVHLLDAAPRLVDVARRRSADAPHPLQSCRVGDARALPFADGEADAVLLLGPLYHLTDAADRRRALQEARRVLRPGGVVFAAAISRFGTALGGLLRDLYADPGYAAIVEQGLRTGQHRNASGHWNFFTTAYLHRPDELQAEVAAAGFGCGPVIGVEGPGWILGDFEQRWADPRRRADLLRVARDLETEPSIVGASAHLLCVGTKG